MKRRILGLGLLLVACGDDDATTRGIDGGSIDGGIMPTADGGDLDASLDGAVDTLCAKYGGAPGIERAIKQYVIQELATDCQVGLHFVTLPANRLARFSDCLTYQAQELFGCPGVRYAGSMSPNGLPCRDMKSAHAGLALTTGDFDAVMQDVATGLTKAGLSREDVDRIAPALLNLEPEVVERSVSTPSQACGSIVDGGTDAGG